LNDLLMKVMKVRGERSMDVVWTFLGQLVL
jgi:hypothetical protein